MSWLKRQHIKTADIVQDYLNQPESGIIDIRQVVQQIQSQGIAIDVCKQIAGMMQSPGLIQLSNALGCSQMQMLMQPPVSSDMNMQNEEMSNESPQL